MVQERFGKMPGGKKLGAEFGKFCIRTRSVQASEHAPVCVAAMEVGVFSRLSAQFAKAAATAEASVGVPQAPFPQPPHGAARCISHGLGRDLGEAPDGALRRLCRCGALLRLGLRLPLHDLGLPAARRDKDCPRLRARD